MIQKERVQFLNDKCERLGDYVLYWMQASQRAEYNHALEYAVRQANSIGKPLLVVFGITDRYPGANERHYYFMLEGLAETQKVLAKRGIVMVVEHQSPEDTAVRWAEKACVVVTDRGYLAIQRKWRKYVARNIGCPLVQVESDVVVPVEQALGKEAYSAAALRPRIQRLLEKYLVPLKTTKLRNRLQASDFDSFDVEDVDRAIGRLDIDRSVKRVDTFRGGTNEGKKHLRQFIAAKLDLYAERKNDPNAEVLSNFSPYLHFGQISPLYVALQVHAAQSPGKDAYLEELIVRRELAINFVHYNNDYCSFACLPNWAKANLKAHMPDKRSYVYSRSQLENAKTHDPYWNAAQLEMVHTGKMHGYMRMYWGKKILEWSSRPQRAFATAVYLNDKYELDGRDANGYAGVAWCFGKHDRPWASRPIFGSVRYMNANGLKRKFDADAYVARIEKLVRE
ncbi:MAG: deoxyribodipyrimidine photo-lyase [Sedimentisphaerales bacterium]|nr:deoxyribodipyrimidine photo-lyase [Sedimentisphaerales bacterium]